VAVRRTVVEIEAVAEEIRTVEAEEIGIAVEVVIGTVVAVVIETVVEVVIGAVVTTGSKQKVEPILLLTLKWQARGVVAD
jgi:hypothetical protein